MGAEPKLQPHWTPYHDRVPTSPWAFSMWGLTITFFVMFGYTFVFLDGITRLEWMGIALCVLGPIFLALGYLEQRLRRSSEGVLASKRHLVCPECLYDLRSVLSQAACPECGTGFDAAKLPEIWRLIDERAESLKDNG